MDTTRADRCSVLGARSPGGEPTTPALERLASTGVTYLDAWSPGGWTAPAHASIFSGLRTERHHVDIGQRMFLDASVPTLATLLREAGWRTAAFTNNELISSSTGMDRGFETVAKLYEDRNRPYPWCIATHEMAVQRAIAADRAGERFFLFVNDMEPHLPYGPPGDVAKRFLPPDATPEEIAAGRAFDFPQTLAVMVGREKVTPRQRRILEALYDAEIATLDAAVGELLARLDAAKILDRTLVVVCGDHGENLLDHGMTEHRFSLHRSVRHVPLVVRLPGKFDGGRRVSGVVRLEDLYPTILEACGLPVPAGIDGESLAQFRGGRLSFASWGPPLDYVKAMRADFPEADAARYSAQIRAVTDGKFHLIRGSDGREEFYDLTADPGETRDLSASGGAALEEMRRLLGYR